LESIFSAGLKVFPIYEDGGYELGYFDYSQGSHDAREAIDAATNLGIPSQTTIFFAADFDALDVDITNNVLPYFMGIKDQFDDYAQIGINYKIGVYGTRNLCSRVCEEGYAEKSFVADMSTGWSGNLGFTMPTNWAYDQFNTITVGNSSLGFVEVDMDGFSGRDLGFDHVTANIPSDEDVVIARQNEFNKIRDNLPILQNLPTSNIAIGKTIYITGPGGPLEISVEIEDQFTIKGDGYDSITIKNGEPSYSISDALGILEYTTPPEQIESFQTTLNNLVTSISYGNLKLKATYAANSFTVSLVVQKVFSVNGERTAQLQITINYKFNYDDPNYPTDDTGTEPDTVPDTSSAAEKVGKIAVGLCFIAGLVTLIVVSGGTVAPVAATAIVAFVGVAGNITSSGND